MPTKFANDYFNCAIREDTFACKAQHTESGITSEFTIPNISKALPITDPDHFPPLGKGIEFVRARQTAKIGRWIKGVFLVNIKQRDGSLKPQIRMMGWEKNNAGEWKNKQKFNISKGQIDDVAEVLLAVHKGE